MRSPYDTDIGLHSADDVEVKINAYRAENKGHSHLDAARHARKRGRVRKDRTCQWHQFGSIAGP